MSHRDSAEKNDGVFKGPVLRLLEEKAAAAWTSGAYGRVREHAQ